MILIVILRANSNYLPIYDFEFESLSFFSSEPCLCLIANLEVFKRMMTPHKESSTRTMITAQSWKTPPKDLIWNTNFSGRF